MQMTENDQTRRQEHPLVSVIVPIYNVEIYIERCIESILKQTLKDIEIILVDDGSPDSCGRIIDRYALWDPRIKVIHKENGGVSSARNAGLMIARGEYIAFVDADDYLEEEYLAYFVDIAENTESDMVIGVNNFTSFNKNQVTTDKQRMVTAETVIEGLYLMTIHVAVWNKLYRRRFLKEKGLLFDEQIWYGEGMLFNIECLQLVDQVALGEKKLYHQVSNPNSAMRKFSLESNYCGIRSMEIQKEKWIKSNKKIESAWNYHYRCFANSILCGLVSSGTVEEHKDVYKKCIKELRSNVLVPLRVNIPLMHKAFYVAVAICPVLMAKRNAWRTKRKLLKSKGKVPA